MYIRTLYIHFRYDKISGKIAKSEHLQRIQRQYFVLYKQNFFKLWPSPAPTKKKKTEKTKNEILPLNPFLGFNHFFPYFYHLVRFNKIYTIHIYKTLHGNGTDEMRSTNDLSALRIDITGKQKFTNFHYSYHRQIFWEFSPSAVYDREFMWRARG